VEDVRIGFDLEAQFFEGLGGVFPKLNKAVFADEAIRLQEDFVLAVMDDVRTQVFRFPMFADVLVHVNKLHHI
jgi:hypothetical protein